MTQILGIETQAPAFVGLGEKDPAVEIWESVTEAAKKLGNLILQGQE